MQASQNFPPVSWPNFPLVWHMIISLELAPVLVLIACVSTLHGLNQISAERYVPFLAFYMFYWLDWKQRALNQCYYFPYAILYFSVKITKFPGKGASWLAYFFSRPEFFVLNMLKQTIKEQKNIYFDNIMFFWVHASSSNPQLTWECSHESRISFPVERTLCIQCINPFCASWLRWTRLSLIISSNMVKIVTTLSLFYVGKPTKKKII